MEGEAFGGDRRAVDEAACHHPPADDGLHRAEAEEDEQPPAVPRRHPAADREPRHRYDQHGDEDPRDDAVQIFPEEDVPERGDPHVGIDENALRTGAIGGIFGRPVGGAQRRDDAADRVPADDRQAGFGQPGDPADDDHGEDEPGDGEQPCGDGDGARAGRRDGGQGGGEGRGGGGHGTSMAANGGGAKTARGRGGWRMMSRRMTPRGSV